MPEGAGSTNGLRYIVDDNGAVGVSVVHGGKGLVTLLAGCIPNLELDCGVFVEGDGLGEESGADGRFSEGVELILVACCQLRVGSLRP